MPTSRTSLVVHWTMLLALASQVHAASPLPIPLPELGQGFPYSAYSAPDDRGRAVRFYLGDAGARDDRALILAVQGSGCTSQFQLRDGRVSSGWHAFLRAAAGQEGQMLVVDKPGVVLFDAPARPGSAESCNPAFKESQTEERWLAALRTAIDGAIEVRGTKPRAIVVVGHSEGAFFAPRLAAIDPRVTHVAVLSSSPLPQLHDFVDMARSGEGFISERPGTREQQLERVLRSWAQVAANPDSASEDVLGHPLRYWKGKFSPLDWTGLARSPAKFFVAHGDADRNSSIRTSDAFAIELLVRGRDFTWLRLHGADHSLNRTGEPAYDGLRRICREVVEWALRSPARDADQVWPLREAQP